MSGTIHENDEFCIKNDGFCINNDELCIKNDEFCSTIFPKLDDDELPTEDKLRQWNQDSQEAYFEQRKAHWNRVSGNDAANACRERGLWPGGTLPLIRDRLLRFDYCRSLLRPCETRCEQDNEAGSDPSESDDDDANGGGGNDRYDESHIPCFVLHAGD